MNPAVGLASESPTTHEAGVSFPPAETLAITVSVKRMIGSELAIAMITTTKTASATSTFPPGNTASRWRIHLLRNSTGFRELAKQRTKARMGFNPKTRQQITILAKTGVESRFLQY
jgi:hypothetical protein